MMHHQRSILTNLQWRGLFEQSCEAKLGPQHLVSAEYFANYGSENRRFEQKFIRMSHFSAQNAYFHLNFRHNIPPGLGMTTWSRGTRTLTKQSSTFCRNWGTSASSLRGEDEDEMRVFYRQAPAWSQVQPPWDAGGQVAERDLTDEGELQGGRRGYQVVIPHPVTV